MALDVSGAAAAACKLAIIPVAEQGLWLWTRSADRRAHSMGPTCFPPSRACVLQYEFQVRQVGCPSCPARVFRSNTPGADLSGLSSGALYNVTVVGITTNKARVAGYNWIAFRTQAVLVRLVRAAAATAACGNTALVTAGGFVGGVASPGAIFKVRRALLGAAGGAWGVWVCKPVG